LRDAEAEIVMEDEPQGKEIKETTNETNETNLKDEKVE
jgi:hypothetical protein